MNEYLFTVDYPILLPLQVGIFHCYVCQNTKGQEVEIQLLSEDTDWIRLVFTNIGINAWKKMFITSLRISLQSCPKAWWAAEGPTGPTGPTWKVVTFSKDFSREACAVSASKKVVGELHYVGGNPSTSFQRFSWDDALSHWGFVYGFWFMSFSFSHLLIFSCGILRMIFP